MRAGEHVSRRHRKSLRKRGQGIKPIPDRLMTELTAYRTLALRDALAQDPDVAFLAALHALCLKLFYRYTPESCLDIDVKSVVFGGQAPGLNDSAVAKAVDERHRRWSEHCRASRPSSGTRSARSIRTAVMRCSPIASRSASTRSTSPGIGGRVRWLTPTASPKPLDLDIVAAGWSPTVDNYFGRVTKARIVEAVREAKGETAAQLIEHLKKSEMAVRAEGLLAGSSWLPEPLRTPGQVTGRTSPVI